LTGLSGVHLSVKIVVLAWLSAWSEMQIVWLFAYGPADAAAVPKPHPLLPQ